MLYIRLSALYLDVLPLPKLSDNLLALVSVDVMI